MVGTNIFNNEESAWNSKKNVFLMWLSNECEVLSDSLEYHRAALLIESEEDLVKWESLFSGDIDEISDINNKIKQWKSDNDNYSKQEFLRDCSINLDLALKRLLMEESPEWALDKLNTMLEVGKISFNIIYDVSKDDPFFDRISKFVRYDWS